LLTSGLSAQPVDAPAPPPYLKDVSIDQKLDAQVPLDLAFRDESGTTIRLADVIHDKPVALVLVYYQCPMLCTMTLNHLNGHLKTMSFEIGKEFDVVTVSFDPREKPDLAAAKKAQYVREYKRSGAHSGWHFLTGDDESIRKLTDAVGFRYAWDEKTQQFAHASGVMVLTPSGRISKYFYGIDYGPNDLKLALMDASQSRIGTLSDVVLQYCFHYDPATGKYSLAIMRILRVLGLLTLAALGTFMLKSFRKDRRAPAAVGKLALDMKSQI
jgi:protein SCO1/2